MELKSDSARFFPLSLQFLPYIGQRPITLQKYINYYTVSKYIMHKMQCYSWVITCEHLILLWNSVQNLCTGIAFHAQLGFFFLVFANIYQSQSIASNNHIKNLSIVLSNLLNKEGLATITCIGTCALTPPPPVHT